MLHVSIGHSANVDLDICVADVIAQVAPTLSGDDDDAAAGVVFVSDSLNASEVLRRLKAAFPRLTLIGCCSSAETSSVLGFAEDSVLLIALAGPDVRFAVGLGRDLSRDPEAAAETAAADVMRGLNGAPAALCLTFVDPVGTIPERAVQHLQTRIGDQAHILGGGTSPSRDREGGRSQVYCGEESIPDAMVVLGVAGDIRVSASTVNSWKPVGRPGRITRSEGATIHTIDDWPALDFYRRNLGEATESFLGAPLAIVESEHSLNLRAATGYDEATGAVRVSGVVYEGDQVQLSYASHGDIRNGATTAAETAFAGLDGKPALVLLVSCTVRKMFLALDVAFELERLRATFGAEAPVAGFYAHGEISAISPTCPPKFRNQAIVAVAIA